MPHHPTTVTTGKRKFMQHTRGLCFNCFSPTHKVNSCTNPTKCWKCLKDKHQAKNCPLAQPLAATPHLKLSNTTKPYPASTPPHTNRTIPTQKAHHSKPKSYLQAVTGSKSPMDAYPGDPRARPAEELCAITATGAAKRERDELIGKTVVCSLNGNSHESQPYHLTDALTSQMDIPIDDMQVVKHHPEQYLVILEHRRDAQRLLSLPSLQSRGRTFYFAPWTEQNHATWSVLRFHVRLRIEGVPVHTWREDVAAQIIGRHCAIHFVEEHSRRKQRTRTYDLWAWCTDPSAIAKKVWLTVADPDRELPSTDIPRPLVHIQHDRPVGVKYGLTYKLFIHLDVLEDLSLPHGSRGRSIDFLWHYGVEDTLGRRREHSPGRQGGGDPPPRRDRDDEDHRRGTRRQRSQSAWGRATRCRGMVDDCYSSTQRFRGRDSGHTPHRSRDATPPSWRGWGRDMYNDNCKKPKTVPEVKPTAAEHSKKPLKKRVTFATPVFQYCSTAMHAKNAPMKTTGPPSLEACIMNMLEAATGGDPIQPTSGSAAPEEQEEGGDPGAATLTPSPDGATQQHVQHPITKHKMEAIKMLVEQGNHPKGKKKTKVAPLQQATEATVKAG